MTFFKKNTSKFTIVFIAIIMTILGCGPDVKTDHDADGIFYLITIDESNPKLATVKVSFALTDSVLYMNPYGADQFPKRWANFVDTVMAIDKNGKALVIEELPDAKWKVNSPIGEEIVVTYAVKLDHEKFEWSGGIDAVAYATDWGVFYTGRALLIMNGEERTNIEVDFSLPQNWIVTTPWNAEPDNRYSYTVNNMEELSESMIFAGLHKEISFKREDFELVFALGGEEIIAQADEFNDLAEGVLDYYIDLMGGIPNPSPSNKFKKSVVIINSASFHRRRSNR